MKEQAASPPTSPSRRAEAASQREARKRQEKLDKMMQEMQALKLDNQRLKQQLRRRSLSDAADSPAEISAAYKYIVDWLVCEQRQSSTQ
jgi:regulator of replication initiation timing